MKKSTKLIIGWILLIIGAYLLIGGGLLLKSDSFSSDLLYNSSGDTVTSTFEMLTLGTISSIIGIIFIILKEKDKIRKKILIFIIPIIVGIIIGGFIAYLSTSGERQADNSLGSYDDEASQVGSTIGSISINEEITFGCIIGGEISLLIAALIISGSTYEEDVVTHNDETFSKRIDDKAPINRNVINKQIDNKPDDTVAPMTKIRELSFEMHPVWPINIESGTFISDKTQNLYL